ncbi:MAG TPA: chemotaxis protein CheB [Usitatibacter sp.]|nr:chemotaxis protein CheB [Usitatibacter sp.]
MNPVVENHLTPDESPPFPIVAIGASAGGLEALSAFLAEVPPATGMAFVIVQHLSPTHESMLSEILGRSTTMPVRTVADKTPVEPNQVYVIPPAKNLVYGEGMLQLSPRTELRGQQRPIDHFMRSLAEEHGYKAIGVVLSGSGNDGSLGIQEIKAGGGITFAQDDSAEQSSMPRSAVATGVVDFVLPAGEIGRELGRIAQHPFVGPADAQIEAHESTVQKIIGMLRKGTGVDFDGYKRNTLNRRIARRMVLHRIEGLKEYLKLLEEDPAEVDALFQDVLINVTSFFRNPDAYEALKATVFPEITNERLRHEPVRIWALGCSTGEEAYSLAMAFTEYAEESGRRVAAQIFATDLNGVGIEKARAGLYAKGVAQDVSPERLRRFFMEVDGSYRIAKPLRDMCVFARQNVLADPPFSRLDLVACRNMLIYLEPSMQQRMIPMLHYALRSGGYLWLGNSETIGSYRDLFDVRDSKNKIYAKKPVGQPYMVPPAVRWQPHRSASQPPVPAVRDGSGTESQRDAERALISRFAPPSVVVNDELDVIQFRGDTGAFLAPAPGKPTLNLLKMLREGLLVGVRSALAESRKSGLPTRSKNLRVRSAGTWRDVEIEVIPLVGRGGAVGSFLVVFEEPAGSLNARARRLNEKAETDAARRSSSRGKPNREKEIDHLRQELSTTREYLQSVIEQQEASNEELQSANEEVQSANEELQSINEEIETSKEEVQSSNEELATVNEELQNRNNELSQSNNDLTNLIGSVQLPIVMLGADLKIRRFTPAAEKLFNLIPGDIGRPVSDVKLNLMADGIEPMVAEVIETMATREREAQDRAGRWHLVRVRPYRTLENVIEGAVIVVVDIDDVKRGEQAVRESEGRFALIANSAPVLIWMNDIEGHCQFVNKALEDFVGEPEASLRGSGISRFVHPEDRAGFEHAYAAAVASRRVFEARARMRRFDGTYRWMKSVASPRSHDDGRIVGYVGGSFDITDLKQAEASLLELDHAKNEFLAMLAHELRNPLAGIRNASRLLEVPDAPETISRAKGIIDRQTGNMVRMIEELLDISRITQGVINIRREPVELGAVVRAGIEATAADRDARQQVLGASLASDPIWVDGDPMRLEQIVSNLLSNASKFTRNGGRIDIELAAEPSRVAPERMSAALRVSDNGVGIDHAILSRIFDPFVQANPSSERNRTGMGLGLTVARRLVELHGGSIDAASAGIGLGSEFIVRLPAIAAPKDAADVAPSRARGTRRNTRRVLVVDDNVDSAESMRMLFTNAGHEVACAHTGAEALEAALEMRPHAVMLDIGLPDTDGYSVAREMRRHPQLRDTLIVATTGYTRPQDQERSRKAGIDEHMAKPVDVDALLDRIERPR